MVLPHRADRPRGHAPLLDPARPTNTSTHLIMPYTDKQRAGLEDRFWPKVDTRGPDECWEWTACVDKWGYGRLSRPGDRGRVFMAHRLALLLAGASLAPGDVVMHSCDNRRCCNPAHLAIGTHQANARDAVMRNRVAHGAKHYRAKLNPDAVRRIRVDVRSGCAIRSVAARLGVTSETIRAVLAGKTWRRVT